MKLMFQIWWNLSCTWHQLETKFSKKGKGGLAPCVLNSDFVSMDAFYFLKIKFIFQKQLISVMLAFDVLGLHVKFHDWDDP